MLRCEISVILIVTIFGCAFFQEVHTLKCWKCSTNIPNEEFCNDPFDPSIISDQQRRLSYDECQKPPGQLNPYSYSSEQKAVCKKITQYVDGKYVVSRSCYWENVNASKNDCSNGSNPSHIKTKFCEICETDGCNGATQIIPNILLILLPVCIVKAIYSLIF